MGTFITEWFGWIEERGKYMGVATVVVLLFGIVVLLPVMALTGAWVIKEAINQAYEWKENYEAEKKKGKAEDEEL